MDNIFVERMWRSLKCEEVSLRNHKHMQDLMLGLTHHFNNEPNRQALDYLAPNIVHRFSVGGGGGAKILDDLRSNCGIGCCAKLYMRLRNCKDGIKNSNDVKSRRKTKTKTSAAPCGRSRKDIILK
jgi:hypothetical protein